MQISITPSQNSMRQQAITVEKQSHKKQINDLHTQFRTYGKSARHWMRKCIMMLPAIDRERVWEKKGFGSLTEYAGKLSGMSHKTVIDGLRIMQTVEHMPDMMKIIEERGIAIVRPILLFLTSENQKFWAEKIKTMSQHTLEMYVHEMKIQQDRSIMLSSRDNVVSDNIPELDIFGERALSETVSSSDEKAIETGDRLRNNLPTSECFELSTSYSPIKKIFAIELEPELIEQLEQLNGKQGDWNQLIRELLQTRESLLATEQRSIQNEVPQAGRKMSPRDTLDTPVIDESVTENPLNLPNRSYNQNTPICSRYIPARIRHFIEKRSRGICEYRTCRRKYSITHHTQRFALKPVHDPQYLVALCTEHERMAHLGLIMNEEEDPKYWKIRNEPDQGPVNSSKRAKYDIDQIVQIYRRPG